jgi:dTDP-4-dehydrorhamnose reductase
MEKITRMKILVIGSTGMLGHVVFKHLSSYTRFELYDVVFRNKLRKESIICDVTKIDDLKQIIENIRPKIIINCIGALINSSNKNKLNAIYLNAFFPHKLKEITATYKIKIIHISTDCVFDGKKGNYTESDVTNSNDIYGKTKSLGDIVNNEDLTIRTSIIGPEIKKNGEGLLHWLLNKNGTVKGFKNSIWTGLTTLELSWAIVYMIENDFKGLIHLSNGIPINKYELISLIKYHFNLSNIDLIKFNNDHSNKSLISERSDFKYKIPGYDKMIMDLKIYYDENINSYINYRRDL